MTPENYGPDDDLIDWEAPPRGLFSRENIVIVASFIALMATCFFAFTYASDEMALGVMVAESQ